MTEETTEATVLRILREYSDCELDPALVEIVPDSYMPDVYAVKVKVDYNCDDDVFFLVNVKHGVDGVEEVEFDNWPPGLSQSYK